MDLLRAREVKNELPIVTVAIPCFNHEKFVQDAIKSIIKQDYKNIELIVIDDGSRDGSVEKIRAMIPACVERFLRFEFRHRKNEGLCATLNECLQWSRGAFFSPLASDDVAFNHKISFLVECTIRDGADVAFGRVINENNKKFAEVDPAVDVSYTQHLFKDLLYQLNIPPAPGSLIKKEALLEVGGFDVNTKLEDWDLWLRLSDIGKNIFSYKTPVTYYRRHESNTTNNTQLIATERLKILKKYASRPEFKSAMCYAKLQNARELSGSRKISALRHLIECGMINKISFMVFLKIMIPNFILAKIRNHINAH